MSVLKGAQQVFFVGIGGIGMSGLARLLRSQEKSVSGSDKEASSITEELREEGIPVVIGHKKENLPDGTELVIFSEAIPKNNPELKRAKELKVPSVTYFQALGELTQAYRLVAVAGSHGKTTTVAMLGLILIQAGKDPTVLFGSKLKEFENRNVRVGKGEFFIVEACEYRRNFLTLKPELLGITNIDLDHLDYFKDQADYNQAFKELAERSRTVIWPSKYREFAGKLAVPGQHNKQNAGLAAELARHLGIDEQSIEKTLATYKGAWRRFEYKGSVQGALIYDDYAHHPCEIQATLKGAREKHPKARIIVIFQPHQYSRTLAFLQGFADSFGNADEVIIPNIYKVRDSAEAKRSISAEALVEAVSKRHKKVRFGQGFKKTVDYLLKTMGEGDLVLVMGAGDVDKLIPQLLERFIASV